MENTSGNSKTKQGSILKLEKIIPDCILPIGGKIRYFLVGPHYGNKKYRLMALDDHAIGTRRAMEEIWAIEDAHLLDALEKSLEK